MDVSENNAWQLHRLNHGKLDHLEFRRQIVMSLLPSEKQSGRKRHRRAQREEGTPRYDGFEHWVTPQEKQTRCAYCHQKCTTRCVKCDTGVHVKCFILYHTPE